MLKRLIVFAATVSAAVSCSHGEDAPLKLGAMSSMDFIPYALAVERGIYDSLGLNLEIVKFYSPNERDAALQAGAIDGTVTDLTGALMMHAAGQDIRMIMKGDGYFTLLASPHSEMVHGESFKGRSFAVSRNTAIEFTTDEILSEAGLGEGDFTKPEINRIPLRLEMLLSGQVDAAVLPDPFATIAASSGAVRIADTRQMGISLTCTVLSGKVLRDDSESVEKLLKGYNLAVDYICSHPVSAWKDILVEYGGVPQELAQKVCLPEYTHAAMPDSSSLAVTMKWLKGKGLVDKDYTMDGLTGRE